MYGYAYYLLRLQIARRYSIKVVGCPADAKIKPVNRHIFHIFRRDCDARFFYKIFPPLLRVSSL